MISIKQSIREFCTNQKKEDNETIKIETLLKNLQKTVKIREKPVLQNCEIMLCLYFCAALFFFVKIYKKNLWKPRNPQFFQIYCKTRLNRVLLRDNLSILNDKKPASKKEINEDETEYGNMTKDGYRSENEDDEDDDDVIEEDDVWGVMEPVKRAKKSSDDDVEEIQITSETIAVPSKNSQKLKRKNVLEADEIKEEEGDSDEAEVKKTTKKVLKKKKRV